MKKLIFALLALAFCTQTALAADFSWASEAVNYCVDKKILSGMEDGNLALGDNLTREQMAKILCDAFSLEIPINREPVFTDIDTFRWSYGYIGAVAPYMFGGTGKHEDLNPTEKVSRQEFCATMILVYGLKNSSLRNPGILEYNFSDAQKASSEYKKLLGVAVERGLMSGSDGKLNPEGLLTRAEACSLLYRALSVKAGTLTILPSELGVIQSETQLCGESEATLSQAQNWARKNGATEAFIDAAEIYWRYGEITGLRADILYAQSAKETGYGKYGGNVKPEQNNFAGIKKYGATGDAPEDHEDFATPEDGVRGHFNHMSAYVGLAPIGEVHARYNSVKSLSWAGSVKTLEGLGGKWCPDLYYGFSVLHNYLEPMKNTN